MARIAVGGLHHETNTFSPDKATFDRFAEPDGWPELLRGDALLTRPRGINLALSGFLEVAGRAGHELVPLVWANAGPSGFTTEDAYERIVGWLLDDLRAALPVDGIFLDLHGAMVTEHLDDGEGELLRRCRALVGDAVPIVAALDLHANVSAAMVELADALVAYRTYPHVDMAETGARCLPLLDRRLSGEPLAKAFRCGDFLVPLPWQCTDLEPSRSLYAEAARLEAELGGSVSIAMGFPAADTPCCGASILAYGVDVEAVRRAADSLALNYAEAEPRFAGKLWKPLEAVRHAQSAWRGRPIVLADTQDNPGGGGTGDTTGLLAALIEARAEGAVLALLCDPGLATAAHRAGVGATLRDHSVGGRSGADGTLPLVLDLDVVSLGDGRFKATGPFYGGNAMDLGAMAALRVRSAPGVTILVATRRIQAADQAMLRHLGVEPGSARILALKSSVHFRADFAALADQILVVEAPGLVVADPRRLPFRKLRAGLRLAPSA